MFSKTNTVTKPVRVRALVWRQNHSRESII